MKILGIIPARYASQRFPGKPLIDIAGQSMIMRVYRQAVQARCLNHVVVATDDERILNEVKANGGEAIMTSPDHRNGTERCLEAYTNYGKEVDYVINIQGDEPLINPLQIEGLASELDGNQEIATLIKRITSLSQLTSPNVVKAVVNKNYEALYFSRAVVPFARDHVLNEVLLAKKAFYKHIGIYAYRVDVLKAIVDLEASELERIESLEQLRWLENAYKIKSAVTTYESPSIDTPEDLSYILTLLNA